MKTTERTWKAIAIDDNCFYLKFTEEMKDAKIRVLGENRTLITELNNVDATGTISICVYTGRPLFVEVTTPEGMAVDYVVNSGADFYQKPE